MRAHAVNAVRSSGWSVQPTFVVGAANTPVTLLVDDAGLTQLAGEPAVAWQVPWSEMGHVVLTRVTRAVLLFATVDAVRYVWRTTRAEAYDELVEIVAAHGGQTVRRRRRAGALVVAMVVLLASFAGGLGAWLNRHHVNHELAAASAVNLTLKDLPGGWSVSSPTILSYLFPAAGQVITSTSTTAPARHSTWATISGLFQHCLGVSATRDRVYGAAGQMPDYQVSSPVFTSLNGDVTVASTTQYYATSDMVRRDRAEMARADFGSCFATSNAAVLFGATGAALPTKNIATTWHPVTFVRGFAAGGVALVSSGAPTRYLVMVTTAVGHFEVTLGALVSSWPQSEALVAGLVNTLLSRTTSTTSTAV